MAPDSGGSLVKERCCRRCENWCDQNRAKYRDKNRANPINSGFPCALHALNLPNTLTHMKQPIVTIYSRTGCHLCENSENLLAPLAETLDFKLEIKLIDGSKELEVLYGQLIPVIHINGEHFSHFRVDLEEFKSSLERHRQRQ